MQQLRRFIKRIAMPYAIRLAGRPSRVAFEKFGGFEVAYRASTADEDVIAHSFDNDIFLSAVPEYKPRADHVVLDVGAHIGTFSILCAPNIAHVHAIEASKETAALAQINKALNRAYNMSVHQVALAEHGGNITLHHAHGNWGHSTVARRSDRNETVPACTLTAFLDAQGVESCQLLKMNIEGGEFPVILNTDKAVLSRFELMVILYHCDLWNKNSEDDLVTHLDAAGFDCRIENRSKHRGWIIATRRH